MKRTALAAFLLVLVSRAHPWAAQQGVSDLPAPIAAARRVLFLGDSITYAGTYVDYVEAAVPSGSRCPKRRPGLRSSTRRSGP